MKILLAGDFCPQLRVQELIDQEQYALIFNDFMRELEGNDFNVVDLECPLTDRGDKIHKTGPHLKASPKAIEALQFAGINVVAMANNHIRDYGAEGLLDTVRRCEASGIRTVGVGPDWDTARKPLYLEAKGLRVAIINITENEWSNTTGSVAGANPLNLVKNFADIREAKEKSDFVIVIYHGGNEFYELPSPRVKETLRFFVDAGASAVIAHHTHIVSGNEIYKQAPIFYSLGNFCFDWPGHRGTFWNFGMAIRLHLRKGEGIVFDRIPFRQNDGVAGIHALTSDEQSTFDGNITRLNDIILDDHRLSSCFDDFCKSKSAIYNIYMEPYQHPWLASLRKRKWIPSMFSQGKKRLILNITRCESHRDVLMKYLED